MKNLSTYSSADSAEPDAIPLSDIFNVQGPTDAGMMTCEFFAFNTVITLQAYADPALCAAVFTQARDLCRTFEREFSRTLPHSDIARINAAQGAPVRVSENTADLLQCALHYCEDSLGCFDITVGSAVRLWDFHEGVIPQQHDLDQALQHVDWRGTQLNKLSETDWVVQLDDPHAALDVGGIAKGWIADKLTDFMSSQGIDCFIVNLGGNVVTHGVKPDNSAWHVGIKNPRDKDGLLGAVATRNASAVTSGIYERCFEKDDAFYHHILDPKTGFPAQTDVAGVTVLAQKSIDAEGYSTTLLALGIEKGCSFVKEHPCILAAYFVNEQGDIISSS